MATHSERQEILITPEGKAKRCFPTERGRGINVNQLIARRQIGLKQTNIIKTGHLEPPSLYAALKIEARTSKNSQADQTQPQRDQHRFKQSIIEPGFQLKTNFAGIDDTEYAPSDCQMASGPDHLIVLVNASWAVFDKSGRQLLRRNFADLFESLADNPLIYKPRVAYDHFRGGWIMATCATTQDHNQSWFFFAASRGADPLGDWWVWAIDVRTDESQPNLRPDSLGLAVDSSSVYLTANMISGSGQFSFARLRIISKVDMQNGGMLHSWDFWQMKNLDGSLTFGLQPAVNLRTPEGQYLINATSDGQGLTLWKVVQSPRHFPTLTRKFMATVPFRLAPDATQERVEAEIETGDTRICQPVYRHGQLWVAHTVAVNWGDGPNRAGIQWFQANPKAGFVTQQGILGAPGYHYFCPGMMVDRAGNMVLVFNRVGENDPPSISYTGKLTGDEPSRLRNSIEMIQSSMPGSCEWNISSAAAIDPEEDRLWMMGQYVATETDWATWIGSIIPTENDPGNSV